MITKLALYLPEIVICSCDEFSAGEFSESCFSSSFPPSIFDQLFSASCFRRVFLDSCRMLSKILNLYGDLNRSVLNAHFQQEGVSLDILSRKTNRQICPFDIIFFQQINHTRCLLRSQRPFDCVKLRNEMKYFMSCE